MTWLTAASVLPTAVYQRLALLPCSAHSPAGSGSCGLPHCRPPDLLQARVHCPSAPPIQKQCHDPSCRAAPLVHPRSPTRQGEALNRSVPERGEQANTHLANTPWTSATLSPSLKLGGPFGGTSKLNFGGRPQIPDRCGRNDVEWDVSVPWRLARGLCLSLAMDGHRKEDTAEASSMDERMGAPACVPALAPALPPSLDLCLSVPDIALTPTRPLLRYLDNRRCCHAGCLTLRVHRVLVPIYLCICMCVCV